MRVTAIEMPQQHCGCLCVRGLAARVGHCGGWLPIYNYEAKSEQVYNRAVASEHHFPLALSISRHVLVISHNIPGMVAIR